VRFIKDLNRALLAGVLIHTASACGDAVVGRRYESDPSSGGSTDSVTVGTSSMSPQPNHEHSNGDAGSGSGSGSGGSSNRGGSGGSQSSSNSTTSDFPQAGTGGVTTPNLTQITSASGGHSSTFTVSYTIPSAGAGGLGGSSSSPLYTGGGTAATTASSQYCIIGVAVNKSSAICDPAPTIGDVDCNGTVDAVDALIVARRAKHMETSPFFEPAGDVNCDGCLTEDDATLISNIDVGLLEPTRCP
jgi:hypothetical protein